MESKELKKAFQSFHKKKILVIGDVMLDQYTFGTVDRISPEAPIPILKKTKEKYVPGGASNVANNIIALGGKAILCGSIGDDAEGKTFLTLLKEKGIDTRAVLINPAQQTTTKHRIVSGNQQLLRLDQESVVHLTSRDEKTILQHLEKQITSCDAVIFSDYAKGFFSKTLTKKIISLAKKHDKKIMADIKPQNKKLFKGVDLLAPNLKEAKQMSGKSTIDHIGKSLTTYFQADILLTQAEMGLSVFTRDGEATHLPARKIEVFDVSGAGDTVIAVATLALVSGLDIHTSAYIANFAAGMAVQKSGTATISVEELASLLQEDKHIETVAIVPKLWGYEKWIENNDKYCSKILSINKGYQCSLHYHKIKDEMFLVTKGHVRLELGDEILFLRPGSFQRVPPNTNHRFRGLEDSLILEISTHHEENDSYRIEESKKVGDRD